MRILFDHGTPRGLAKLLPQFAITRASSMGWAEVTNGQLLRAAEEAEFDVLLTTDRGIRYQQNLMGRKIAIVVLVGSTKWSRVRLNAVHISQAVQASTSGSYLEVFIPFD